MTHSEWLKIRTEEQLPIEVFFQYYSEKGGHIKDLTEFTRYFIDTVKIPKMVSKGLGMRYHLNYDTAIKRVYDYFDATFNIQPYQS